jgi:hypothetical protein
LKRRNIRSDSRDSASETATSEDDDALSIGEEGQNDESVMILQPDFVESTVMEAIEKSVKQVRGAASLHASPTGTQARCARRVAPSTLAAPFAGRL